MENSIKDWFRLYVKIQIKPSLSINDEKDSFHRDLLTFSLLPRSSSILLLDAGGRSVGIKSNNILEDLWMRYISRRKDSTEGIPIGSIGATKLYSPYKEKNSRRVQSTKGRGYFGMRSLVRGWIVYWTVLIERPQTLFCKRVTAIRNWINFRRTSNSASRIQFLLRF